MIESAPDGHPAERDTLSVEPTTVRWSTRTEEAAWALPLLDDLVDGTVCFRVPHGFEAYARVLHPIETRDERLSWREVAERNGKTFRSTIGYRSLALPTPTATDGVEGLRWQPVSYRTPREVLHVLVEHLARQTATPSQTWGACWDGMGFETKLGCSHEAGVIHLGGNPHQLFTGSVADLDALADYTPNLWWPADRAWVLGRFIEDGSTYIAGRQQLINQLLSDSRLEVVEVRPDDRIGTDETRSPPLTGRE